MTIDLAIIAFCYFFFSAIGYPFTTKLKNVRCAYLISPTIGYGIIGILITLLYPCGISMITIFYCLVISWLIIVLIIIPQKLFLSWRNGKLSLSSLNTERRIILLGWLVGTFLLILPKWTGGIQFSVFQGNQWDQFNYLTSAIIYGKENFDSVFLATNSDFLKNPLLIASKLNLSARPTVMLLYSFVSQLFPSFAYKTHYTYLVFFFSNSILCIYFLLTNFFDIKKTNYIFFIFISLAFPIGFWGQYVMDINAWSQISSIPILIVFTSLIIIYLTKESYDMKYKDLFRETKYNNKLFYRIKIYFTQIIVKEFWDSVVLMIIVASALYFYPENLLFHLAGLFVSFVFFVLAKYPLNGLRKIIISICCGISIGYFNYNGIVNFVLSQLSMGTSFPVYWWAYFDRFYLGQDYIGMYFDNIRIQLYEVWLKLGEKNANVSIVKLALPYVKDFLNDYKNWLLLSTLPTTVLAGLFGIYFLTPVYSWNILVRLILFILLSIFIFHILYASCVSIVKANNNRVKMLIIFLVVMFSFCLILILKNQIWAAGKGISYLSPYLMIILLLPMILNLKKDNRWFIITAIILLLSQFMFGIVRPINASTNTGIHYPSPPYPSIQYWHSKTKLDYDWDVDKISNSIKNCTLIKIDIPDIWLQHYVMLFLYSKQKPFYIESINNEYYGLHKDIEFQKSAGKEDCMITTSKNAKNRKLQLICK